jgi:UDP-2,3-diacylglucosamine pyrophosphatase LpxH
VGKDTQQPLSKENLMKTASNSIKGLLTAASLTLAILMAPQTALAHCDSLDGPVVADARVALATGDITPVLKWLQVKDEKEVRETFARTLAVRKLDPEAQKLADTYFFETLVRVHRAGEGAPYTGLKAAGTIEPVVAKADQALEQGVVDGLAKAIATHTEEGIRERFKHTLKTRKHAQDSVQAGREYVEAYVTYVHYVEGIAQAVHGSAHHADTATPEAHQH